MKKLFLIAFTSVMFLSCESQKTIIKGDLAHIGNQDIELYVRDSSVNKRMLAKTEAKNGKFNFTIESIKAPVYTYLTVDGFEVRFILEPGTINIESKEKSMPIVSGTNYNDMIYGWRRSEEAIQINNAMIELDSLIPDSEDETNIGEMEDSISMKFSEYRSKEAQMEREALQKMAESDDVYSRLFSIIHDQRFDEKAITELENIEKVIGKNGEIDYVRKTLQQIKTEKEQNEKIVVGRNFIDFTATKVDGTTVKLSESVTKNKLTMLEFWASWCSPCRAEIPHMKKIYETYKPKGFEIFSFSIDTERDAWVAAEEKENLPWMSTSGEVKSVSESYVIKSIPQNILIDGSGKIVAKNLTGEELVKFIQEFLH